MCSSWRGELTMHLCIHLDVWFPVGGGGVARVSKDKILSNCSIALDTNSFILVHFVFVSILSRKVGFPSLIEGLMSVSNVICTDLQGSRTVWSSFKLWNWWEKWRLVFGLYSVCHGLWWDFSLNWLKLQQKLKLQRVYGNFFCLTGGGRTGFLYVSSNYWFCMFNLLVTQSMVIIA